MINKNIAVDEYIHQFTSEKIKKLEEIRGIILEVLPEETAEIMSYGMPAYKLGKNIVYFGAAKNHLGFYPGSNTVNEFFVYELEGYKTTKGSIHFPYEQALPKDLIQNIVKFRLDENQKG